MVSSPLHCCGPHTSKSSYNKPLVSFRIVSALGIFIFDLVAAHTPNGWALGSACSEVGCRHLQARVGSPGFGEVYLCSRARCFRHLSIIRACWLLWRH
jgi:hypothetical protein